MSSKSSLPRDAATLLHQLGAAITVWQHLENALGELFCALVGEHLVPNGPARAAYCSVLNFGIRLDMVQASVRAKVADPAALSYWNELYRKTSIAAKNRNRLVHYGMVHDARPRTEGFYLAPGPTSPAEFFQARDGKGTRWDATQVAKFTEDFGVLQGDLWDFATLIKGR
jgi:hypothetical protein